MPSRCIKYFVKKKKLTIYSGHHYYWDWSSDLVSWLPPGHPKCQISQPASQLREELHLKAGDQDDNMSSDDSTSDQEQMEVSIFFIYNIFVYHNKFTINIYDCFTYYSGRRK